MSRESDLAAIDKHMKEHATFSSTFDFKQFKYTLHCSYCKTRAYKVMDYPYFCNKHCEIMYKLKWSK